MQARAWTVRIESRVLPGTEALASCISGITAVMHQFNLARAGFNVSKYVPYGPVREVVPYLIRRAEENRSISGQVGRELRLIQEEINRRMHAQRE